MKKRHIFAGATITIAIVAILAISFWYFITAGASEWDDVVADRPEPQPTQNIAEIWVRHPASLTDYFYQHMLINIDGVFYDYFEYHGEESLEKKSLASIVAYYSSQGTDSKFTIFVLSISDDEKIRMREHLEYWHKHQADLPEFWGASNNCADYIAEELLNEFADFRLDTSGITTPSGIAEQLRVHPKVKEVYDGEIREKQFYRSETPEAMDI